MDAIFRANRASRTDRLKSNEKFSSNKEPVIALPCGRLHERGGTETPAAEEERQRLKYYAMSYADNGEKLRRTVKELEMKVLLVPARFHIA